jgi:hypothetical protein
VTGVSGNDDRLSVASHGRIFAVVEIVGEEASPDSQKKLVTPGTTRHISSLKAAQEPRKMPHRPACNALGGICADAQIIG